MVLKLFILNEKYGQPFRAIFTSVHESYVSNKGKQGSIQHNECQEA